MLVILTVVVVVVVVVVKVVVVDVVVLVVEVVVVFLAVVFFELVNRSVACVIAGKKFNFIHHATLGSILLKQNTSYFLVSLSAFQ